MPKNRRGAAGKSRKPSNAAPLSPDALHQAALRHVNAARPLDAQLCCEQALKADPAHAASLHLMGVLCLQSGQHDHAVAWLSRAIRQHPDPDYLLTLGKTLQAQRRFDEALQTLDKAIQLKPDNAALWRHLGHVLQDLNRIEEALLGFQHALALDPGDFAAAGARASLLFEAGRLEQAVTAFDWCDRIEPDHAPTLQMRAMAKYGLDRFEDGLADLLRAQARDPANAELCSYVGVFLQRLGRHAEALPWFERALERNPDFSEALTNKASSLSHLRRFDEAVAAYQAFKRFGPGEAATADWAIALLDLLRGNFEDGWAGREARYRVPDLSIFRFTFPQPIWLGRPSVAGKTVLIHVDEGLGDTIQFARYVPMVAALGARAILVVAEPLRPLLSGLSGVSECFAVGQPLPAFDFYCPISSLPLAFGTRLETVPAAKPYLPAPAPSRVQAWETRLGGREQRRDTLRVGLVWSGNPKHTNDYNRSIPLRMLQPLLDADADFVSLQKDPKPEDGALLSERSEILDVSAHLTDFVETAALLSCLDLVITVDTSIAHLAGALGRPTWILLPRMPDYRWMLDREDSPWYPTARLFRQRQPLDYAEVIDRVRSELAAVTSTRQA